MVATGVLKATFILKASGDSMTHGGILSGDLLVVDRSLHGKTNDIVIAAINGDMTVKRLLQDNGRWILRADSPDYPDIIPDKHSNFFLWGVVTSVVRPIYIDNFPVAVISWAYTTPIFVLYSMPVSVKNDHMPHIP